MKQLSYWQADWRLPTGQTVRGWFGRVREGKKHRYFGPHDSPDLLFNRVAHVYANEPMELMPRPEWDDVGPADWEPTIGEVIA